MAVNTDNSSTLANDLFTALTAGTTVPASPDFSDAKFDITPDTNSDLYSAISGASIAEVTSGDGTLTGPGAFDVFMQAMDKHLEREFKGNRITGSQYAEVYTAIANQVMGQAVSFTLQKDQSKWAAVTAQMQARIAEIQATQSLVELEKTKIEAAQADFQLNLTAAQYALTKMQIATEEANHDSVTADVAIKEFQREFQQPSDLAITDYQVSHVLPAQVALTDYERTAVLPADVAIKAYQVSDVMPSEVAINDVQSTRILPAQASLAEYENQTLQPLEADLQTLRRDRMLPAEASISEYQNQVLQPLEAQLQEIQRDRILPLTADIEQFRLDELMPVELAQQQHILNRRQVVETKLVEEQIESERANTLDTRQDGITPISGVIGLQKRNLTSDADIKDYNLTNIMPGELGLLTEQRRNLVSDADIKDYNLANTLPKEVDILIEQKRNLTADGDIKDYNLLNIIPKEADILTEQINNLVADKAIKDYNLASTLPSELAILVEQKRNLVSDADIKDYNLANTLPRQLDLLNEQILLTEEQVETERANTLDTRQDGVTQVSGLVGLQKRNLVSDADIKDYNLLNTLPRQVDLVVEQVKLTEEQVEAERAKTLDTRTDGTPVVGSVGKQKELYDQQIDSFVKDAQHKTAKMYLDSWITRKTLDIGVPVPAEFSETNVSSVFGSVKTNNNL